MTLISAPAGTGKTVAIATWAASGRAPGPVIWIEVGDLGTSVAGLWATLIKALRRAGVWVRQKPADAVAGMYPTVVDELSGEVAEHREPLTVVLDCNDELPADTAAALHQLLVGAAGRLRLVLLCRADPLLPLHRYRLAQSVVEVRMADLAFTTAEARELLLRRGVDLSPDVVESVNERTHGWAAGLLLAAMSMAGTRDPVRSAQELSGAAGPIAEYLLAEVLEKQPATVRDALLRSSLVEVLRPGLIEVLIGEGGARALAMLSRGSAFVDEVPAQPGWYRYHPLFRELLCAQFNYESPDEAVRLRMAVADWYAENGLLDDAVRTAIAVSAWDAATRYIVDDVAVVALVEAEPDNPLHRAAEQLPDDLPGVEASLLRAAVALAHRQYHSCAAHLRCAQQGIEAGLAESPEADAVQLAVLLMLLAAGGSGPRAALSAAVHAASVINDLPTGHTDSRPEIARVVHRTWASAALDLGRLDDASEAYESVTHARLPAGSVDAEREYVDALGHLALLAAWRGKMRRAVRLAHQALAFRGESSRQQAHAVASAEVALGYIYAETHDLGRAQRYAAEAVGHGAGDGDVFVRVASALVNARVNRAAGDLAAARGALAVAGTTPPKWLRDTMVVEQARIELSAGRPTRADAVLAGGGAPQTPAAELVRTEGRMRAGRPIEPVDHLPALTHRPVLGPPGPHRPEPGRVTAAAAQRRTGRSGRGTRSGVATGSAGAHPPAVPRRPGRGSSAAPFRRHRVDRAARVACR